MEQSEQSAKLEQIELCRMVPDCFISLNVQFVLNVPISETFDAYMSALNNNMNEVMKVLSIFAATALPMTVISGVYGTNFTTLPGSKNVYGFWIMIFAMVAFSVGMVYFFRKRKWF